MHLHPTPIIRPQQRTPIRLKQLPLRTPIKPRALITTRQAGVKLLVNDLQIRIVGLLLAAVVRAGRSAQLVIVGEGYAVFLYRAGA